MTKNRKSQRSLSDFKIFLDINLLNNQIDSNNYFILFKLELKYTKSL